MNKTKRQNKQSRKKEDFWEKFSRDVKVMSDTVLLAGNKAVDIYNTFTEDDVIVKTEDSVGKITASMTPADLICEELIFSYLSKASPDAKFLMEEKIQTAENDETKILNYKNYLKILKGLGYIVDPLDGTNEYKNNRKQWSISIGKIQDGEFTAGSIFAPKLNLLVTGEKNIGVMVKDRHPQERFADIITGQDLYELPNFKKFTKNLTQRSEHVKKIGSCALGFALVAAGKADVCIQPHQFPWDFAAGVAIIKAKGGQVIYYHYRENKIVRIDKPDDQTFNHKNRETAVIASLGNQAEQYFEQLQLLWKST